MLAFSLLALLLIYQEIHLTFSQKPWETGYHFYMVQSLNGNQNVSRIDSSENAIKRHENDRSANFLVEPHSKKLTLFDN